MLHAELSKLIATLGHAAPEEVYLEKITLAALTETRSPKAKKIIVGETVEKFIPIELELIKQ
ncbi:hypothetical protein [Neisseria animaloris]|uniref:hypothetical protein n=1 Tax=Neisseria animaloris TaxID=326522 RepID=UPI000D33FCA0|nr:hypothetical protein [Neisseria animaloris]